MELTYEKKRRNLMITASAVVAAALLQIDRPGMLLAALIGKTSLPSAWRFWVVVLVVLLYQAWRLYTDRAAKEKSKLVRVAFLDRVKNLAEIFLENQALSLFLKQRPSAIKDQKNLSFRLVNTSDSGQILSINDVLEIGYPPAYTVLTIEHGRETSIGEITLDSPVSRSKRAGWKLKALAGLCVNNPDAQDLLVPLVLSSLAVGWCALKIRIAVAPLLIWI